MSTIITYPKRPRGPSITCFADVRKIAPRMGLTESTMSLLIERGFASVQAMRDLNEADLELFPLYAGQQLAVSKLVTHLNEALHGHEINDGEKKPEPAQITNIARTLEVHASKDNENGEKEATEVKDKEQTETSEEKSPRGTILTDFAYPEGQKAGNRRVPRPHEFLVGKTGGKELSQDEFLYGNLMILEYMVEQGSAEVRAHVKHMRFMVLKLIHGYPLEQVVYYDYALRNKMEKEDIFMPLEADGDLLEKYVGLIKRDRKKKKSSNKKNPKGKKKTKEGEDDDGFEL